MCWKNTITTTHRYPIPLNFLSGGWTVPTVWVRKIAKVRGLVEGGVHLLLLDMVSDTLNAKAAVYAIKDCKKGWKVWSLEGFFVHGKFGKNSQGWPSFFLFWGHGFGGRVLLGREFGSLDEDADEDEGEACDTWGLLVLFMAFFFSVSWEDEGIWRRSWPRRGLTPKKTQLFRRPLKHSPVSLGILYINLFRVAAVVHELVHQQLQVLYIYY